MKEFILLTLAIGLSFVIGWLFTQSQIWWIVLAEFWCIVGFIVVLVACIYEFIDPY